MSRTGVSVAPTSTSSTSPNLHTWHAMHHLSPELLHAVFSYLPYFDLATCERICQTWRSLIVASPHLWMRQAISCLPPHRKARPTLLCGEMDNKDFVRKAKGWNRRWWLNEAEVDVDEEVDATDITYTLGDEVTEWSLSSYGGESDDETTNHSYDDDSNIEQPAVTAASSSNTPLTPPISSSSIATAAIAAYASQHSPPKPISALPDFPLVANRGRLPPLPTSQTRTIISAISHRMNIFIAETNTTLWVSQERDDGLRYGVLDLTAPVMRVNWCHSHRDIVSGRFLMLSNVDGSMWMAAPLDHRVLGVAFFDPIRCGGNQGPAFTWWLPYENRYSRIHVRNDRFLSVTGLLTRTMEYYALPKASTLANASKAQRTPKALWSIGINANETGVSMNDDVVAVVRFGVDSEVSLHSTKDGTRFATVPIWRRGISDIHLTRTHLLVFNESHRREKGACRFSHRLAVRDLSTINYPVPPSTDVLASPTLSMQSPAMCVDMGRAGVVCDDHRCEFTVAADESGVVLLTNAMRTITVVEPCGGRDAPVVMRRGVPLERFVQISEVGFWVIFREGKIGGVERGRLDAAWVVLEGGDS